MSGCGEVRSSIDVPQLPIPLILSAPPPYTSLPLLFPYCPIPYCSSMSNIIHQSPNSIFINAPLIHQCLWFLNAKHYFLMYTFFLNAPTLYLNVPPNVSHLSTTTQNWKTQDRFHINFPTKHLPSQPVFQRSSHAIHIDTENTHIHWEYTYTLRIHIDTENTHRHWEYTDTENTHRHWEYTQTLRIHIDTENTHRHWEYT